MKVNLLKTETSWATRVAIAGRKQAINLDISAVALRVWWSWHGVDVCGRWWLTGLQGLGAAVRWWWWALAVAVLLVCPGGLGVGWCGVAGPGPWSGRRALLVGALAGPLTCLGLLGLVGFGGG